MTYITTTIPELSGLCYSNGFLYGVSDDAKHGNSGIYKVNKETGETELFVSIDADLEGITCDPDGNFYVCTENDMNEDLTNAGWGSEIDGTSHTSCILKITPDKEVTLLGKYTNEASEQNKGLEGIAYFDTVDNEPRFLIGNQKKPIVLMLWSQSQGIISQVTLIKDSEETETSEIGDLYYDGEFLYILDSTTAIVYKYTIEITSSIVLTLVDRYNYRDTIDMSTTLNDGDGENPEALTIVDREMLVGCDYNSRIYSFPMAEEPIEDPIEEPVVEPTELNIPSSLQDVIQLRINDTLIIKAYCNGFLVYQLNSDSPIITTDSVIATGVWKNDSLWNNDDLYSNN